MAKEIDDRLTFVSEADIGVAIQHGWCRYNNAAPANNDSIFLLMAQWALETNRGKAMHNFNVGNVKDVAGVGAYDWQYFPCEEDLDHGYAAKLSTSPLVKIVGHNAAGLCTTWFYPKHPGCCFRAFETLDDGVLDHLVLLNHNPHFKCAWPAVLQGNPQQFVHLLKASGYFTASEAQYTKSVTSLFLEYKHKIVLPPPPTFTDVEQAQISSAVALSMQNQIDNADYAFRSTTDEVS